MQTALDGNNDTEVLARGLAHKVRNILNAMQTHLALARRFAPSRTDGRLIQQFDKLEDDVSAVETLLSQFLLCADPALEDHRPINLRAFLKVLLDDAADDFAHARIEVVRKFDRSLPTFRGDRLRLTEAIRNVIMNAQEAMPDGGRLTISAQKARDDVAVLEFADTGTGIANDDAERIFEPFFSTRNGRLGLSLAITKRTIEAHGGKISVRPTSGGGATFRIELPGVKSKRKRMKQIAKPRGRQRT